MSMFRKITWYLKGRSTFTKSGFQKASRRFTEDLEDADLTGRSFLVTGANSGIGLRCAHYFAKKGGSVHMVCRNSTLGQEAQHAIIEAYGNKDVFLHVVDLADSQALAHFALSLVKDGVKVDVLVNNAGCMLHDFSLTESGGIETNFAVNSLAPFLLTTLLQPLLEQSSDPRVVFVSSGGMLLEKLNASDPQLSALGSERFDGIKAYSQQKRQQVVMAAHFAERYPSIMFASMHPGWADTPAVRTALPDFYEKMKDDLRTDVEGADTVMWLCATRSLRKEDNGKFFFDRAVAAEHLFLGFTHHTENDVAEFINALELIAEPILVREALD